MEQSKTTVNDKMVVLEDEAQFEDNAEAVEALMREFAEELKPIGIACKSWAKST